MKELSTKSAPGVKNDLSFTRQGTGTLFYTARLRYAVDAPVHDSMDNGFRIERRYARVGQNDQVGPPSTTFKAGDLVQVTLSFELTKERRFVAVTDPLPAGFEPVESWFNTTASSLTARQDRHDDEDGDGDTRGWRGWWERGGFDHVERHDNRVLLFATRLSEGRHTFSIHRPRHHRRHVPHGAGARGGNVRTGSIWTHGVGDGGGGTVMSIRLPRWRPRWQPQWRSQWRPQWRLRRLQWRRRERVLAAASLVTVVGVLAWLRCGPLPDGLLEGPAVRSTVVRDRSGVILHEARADDGTRQMRLEADALPDLLVKATLAAEDHRFRRHPGIDPIAIARAAARNVWSGSREGGSTITQQTVKLLLARRDPDKARARTRSWSAKIEEAIIALRLEHRLTKPEIMTLYLNAASYGNQLAGAERASRAYFGTSASMLTPAQAAFLAALPHRPSTFNPYRDPRGAQARQKRIIGRMRDLGFLSPGDATIALGERLRLSRDPSSFIAPHFVEMVLNGSIDAGSSEAGSARPEVIDTTLDANLQRDVQGIIQRERAALDKAGAHNVAVVVLDNSTGGWLAWEGSGNYHDSEHGGTINGALTPRQPGSALKPFTYALAFEDGHDPSTVLADVPSHFPTAEPGVLYNPRNYDGRFRGPLRARLALAGSENVPAVALLSDLGVPTLMRFLRHGGFSTFDKTASHYGLGLTLGNAEVRLDELVGAYAAFARGGVWIRPHAVTSSSPTVSPSATAASASANSERVSLVSERTAFWITDVLSDPEARAYAFGRGGSLEFPFPVAVKTGTSQAYRDNWTIGYTREITVGVWVGNFDREPLRSSSGVAGAGPIFHSVMMAAIQRLRGHVTIDDQPMMSAPSTRDPGAHLRAVRLARERVVPDAGDGMGRVGSGRAAVQLASSLGRRPAHDLA